MSSHKHVGVSIPLLEERLSKNNKIAADGSILQYSQINLLKAACVVSSEVYNTATALIRAHSHKELEFISERLYQHLGVKQNQEELSESSIKFAAYSKAAKWVKAQWKKELTPKSNHVALAQRDQTKRYVKQPAVKPATAGKITEKAHKENLINAVHITLAEVTRYAAVRDEAYREFRATCGTADFLTDGMKLEQVMRQITGASTHKYDGETLHFHPSAKQAAADPGLKPVSYVWRSEIIKQQLAEHPFSFTYDEQQKKFMVTLPNDDSGVMYPVPTRILVQAAKDVAEVNKKYVNRFFENGNKESGMSRFRSYRDPQNFSTTLPASSPFKEESAGVEHHLKNFADNYEAEHGKKPSKALTNGYKKQYEAEWSQTAIRKLANTTRINLGGHFGWMPVNKHGLKRLWKLLQTPGAELANDYRISLVPNGTIKLSMTVKMPENWSLPRPDSYYLNEEKSIGVDPGVITAITTSTGYVLPNINRNSAHEDKGVIPYRSQQEKHFDRSLSYTDKAYAKNKQLLKKRKALQQQASAIYTKTSEACEGNKRETYSKLPKSWHALQAQIRTINAKMANINNHHSNVAAKLIASNYDHIGVEDLNLHGLLAKNLPKIDEVGNYVPNGQTAGRGLRKALSSVAISKMLSLIETKSAYYGSEVTKVDRWFASSLLCSSCGTKKSKNQLSLSERTYTCTSCGVVMDRDMNAAVNIIQEAERLRNGDQTNPDNIVDLTEEANNFMQEVTKNEAKTKNDVN